MPDDIKSLRAKYDALAKQVTHYGKFDETDPAKVGSYARLRQQKLEAFTAWHDAANAPQKPVFVDEVPSGNLKTLPQVSTIKEAAANAPQKPEEATGGK